MPIIFYILLSWVVGFTVLAFVLQRTKTKCSQYFIIPGIISVLLLVPVVLMIICFWIPADTRSDEWFGVGLKERVLETMLVLNIPFSFVAMPAAFVMAFSEYRSTIKDTTKKNTI
ncbi:MAG: hypothetical protein ACHP6H_02225 [Legionellales bacterium]